MSARDRTLLRPAFAPRQDWAARSPRSDVVQRRGDGALVAYGVDLGLAPRQESILLLLVRHPGRLITTQEIAAWAWEEPSATRDAVTSAVKRIRSRLREVGVPDRHLVTVRGLGYRWDEEAADDVGWVRAG